ncbi:DegT/DnrJ/EryC1/StrS family aminotransferase [Candidatus Peribacteria bacterium]|nr:MAG: DegT/DnrJ/EryC1/StrS family aminotransferase [Candidatus Peribacteria bacterium]
MSVPFLDLQAQYRTIKDDIGPAIQKVLDSSAYILGPAVESFEKEFAAYCGTSHCVAVNSGTAALALLMQAYDIGEGDEVITVTNSFFASAEAISEIGAIPVLVDCTPDTALMDPALIEAAITPHTKAILPVHLYGQPVDMDAIMAIGKKHGVLVFEDACQAHGALYNGKRTGSLGDGAAFSFYPGKNLGCYGEGGAVTTNDAEIAQKLRVLREHGSPKKYHHDVVGWNERMDGIQGAVLGVKLPHLDNWNNARRSHAEEYLAKLPEKAVPIATQPGSTSVYHLFIIRVADRDRVQKELADRGIATGIHYPVPIHLQPAYASNWKKGDFPHSEKLAEEILSLPMFPELTSEQIDAVISALNEVL